MKKQGVVNPRELALKILFEIETGKRFADESVNRYSEEFALSSLDRRFLSELVNGTTKLRRRMDYLLESVLSRKAEELTPWIRNILRMGVYQIDHLTRVPNPAAVNESVKLAQKYGHRGTKNLVNAVLRNYLRKKDQIRFPQEDKVGYFEVFYSFPGWMITRWLKDFGEKSTKALCETFNSKPKFSLRVNSLKTSSRLLVEDGRCVEGGKKQDQSQVEQRGRGEVHIPPGRCQDVRKNNKES
jgi:Transcription termination factor